jgi:hypothetical protein
VVVVMDGRLESRNHRSIVNLNRKQPFDSWYGHCQAPVDTSTRPQLTKLLVVLISFTVVNSDHLGGQYPFV